MKRTERKDRMPSHNLFNQRINIWQPGHVGNERCTVFTEQDVVEFSLRKFLFLGIARHGQNEGDKYSISLEAGELG